MEKVHETRRARDHGSFRSEGLDLTIDEDSGYRHLSVTEFTHKPRDPWVSVDLHLNKLENDQVEVYDLDDGVFSLTFGSRSTVYISQAQLAELEVAILDLNEES
jgi:hypothetical protein